MAGVWARLGLWLRSAQIGQFLAIRLGAFYVWLCLHTMRWTIEGREAYDAAAAEGPFIVSMWHGRLFFSPTWAPARRTVAVISRNRDGDVIAGIVGCFGVEAARGSTYDKSKRREKGGADVFRAATTALEEGAVVAITPDGPRGPRMRAQLGAAMLAINAGVPVFPVAFSARGARILSTWDKFVVPFPFTRGAMVYGPRIDPPAEATPSNIKAFRQAIEEATTAGANRADDLCGRPHIEPEASAKARGPDAAAE